MNMILISGKLSESGSQGDVTMNDDKSTKCGTPTGSVGSPGDSIVSKEALWNQIEKDLLNGQKLQGTLTCQEIMAVLRAHYDASGNGGKAALQQDFPFFSAVDSVAFDDEVFPSKGNFYRLLSA